MSKLYLEWAYYCWRVYISTPIYIFLLVSQLNSHNFITALFCDSWISKVVPLSNTMCDAECQASRLMENAKEETAEVQNIILCITFLLLVCLVYITGLIGGCLMI